MYCYQNEKLIRWNSWLLLCTESYFVAIFLSEGTITVRVIFFLSGPGEITPSLNRVSNHFMSVIQVRSSELLYSRKWHMNIGPFLSGYVDV